MELAEGVSLEDVVSSTGCLFEVADPLKPMQQVDLDD